jgi:predicted TIM-barrel fold metal-dependent hydrolase
MDDDLRLIDSDNHFYEQTDALTRYLPERFRRSVYWVDTDFGHRKLVIDKTVFEHIGNPTFDPAPVPGAMQEIYRRRADQQEVIDRTLGYHGTQPLSEHPEYFDADARLTMMDRQAVGGAIMFPSLFVGIEEAVCHDLDLAYGVIDAYNLWVAETWPFSYQGRIFSMPAVCLSDPSRALSQVQFAHDRNARLVMIRPGPVRCPDGYHSPGDRRFDPVWAAIEEADLAVGMHSAATGFWRYASDWTAGQNLAGRSIVQTDTFRMVTEFGRMVSDTVAALVVHGVFTRFPRLRVMLVENGTDWVPGLMSLLGKFAWQYPDRFPEDPVRQIHEHVWLAPFWEEDMKALSRLIPVDRILAGSDYPHPEGLAEPLTYVEGLTDFDDTDRRRILRDNALVVLGVGR